MVEAARLARLTGKPVQVAWTRAEEFFYDSFQPAGIVKVASGLDASKRMVFWDYHVYFAGGDRAPSFYDVPHQRTTAYGSWRGTPTGLHILLQSVPGERRTATRTPLPVNLI